jgi:hypothetical protein
MAEEIHTVRVVVTNISRSPRGVNKADGTHIILDAGATSPEIEMTPGEITSLRNGQEFRIQELGDGSTITRHRAEPRRSKVNVHDDQIAGLKDQIEEMRADIAELKNHAADTEDGATAGDRAELKKQAADLGIEFAKNIPTDKLKELIDAKLAEQAA